MNTCLDERTVHDFVDGRLGREVMAGVERHLDECVWCFRLLAEVAHAHGDVEPLTLPWPRFEANRYHLRGEHGRGGIGVVMRAFDRRFGREVALKILISKTPEARARFAREATITSRLLHPSIVTVLDAGRLEDETLGYTMPLYPSRLLRQAIAERSDPSERLGLLRHVLAIAEAIAHAHERGVLHRDLKPSNVLLGDLGETIVIDWGLAKTIGADDAAPRPISIDPDSVPSSDGTTTGAVLGTPSYMPPEQARGDEVGPLADVYALGAILYHVVAGRAPFEGPSSESVLEKVRSELAVDVLLLAPSCPDDLAAIVRKAMAPALADRYRSAAAFAEDLRRFLDGRLVEAHAYTFVARASRWLQQHRGLARLGIAAFAAVVAMGVVGLQGIRRERRVAEVAAGEARARGDRLLLTQAASALLVDPTQAISWLATYPEDGADWSRVRALADEAVQRGIARRVLYRNSGYDKEFGVRPDGRTLVGFDGPSAIRAWDLERGTSRAICLEEELAYFDPDSASGPWMAYLGVGGSVHVWQPESDQLELVDRRPDFTRVAISSDGRWVTTASDDGAVRTYDRERGHSALLTWTRGRIDGLLALPGGHLVVVEPAGAGIEVWDVERGTLVYRGAPVAQGVWVGPDGRHLVWGSHDGLTWVDLATGALAYQPVQLARFEPVSLVADGRVVVSDINRGALLWDPQQQKVTTYLRMAMGAVSCVSDANRIACGDQIGRVSVSRLDGSDFHLLKGHGALVLRIVLSPDGRSLISADQSGSLRQWSVDLDAARAWPVDKPGPRRPNFAVRPDGGEIVASSSDGTLWRRSLPEGEPVRLGQNRGRALRLAYLPGGKQVLVADAAGELSRWSLPDGRRELLASGLPTLHQLLVSADGRWAVGMSFHDAQVWAWDLRSGAARQVPQVTGDYMRAAFLPDGKSLASGGSPDGVHEAGLFDLESGAWRPLDLGVTHPSVLGVSPSGRYLFGAGSEGVAFRYDLLEDHILTTPVHRASFLGGVLLPSGALITSGRGRLSAWVPELGLDLTFDEPGTSFGELQLSPSGTRLLGSGTDASLHVWELSTGERFMVEPGHQASSFTASWAGDEMAVSTSQDGTLRFWPLPVTAPRTSHETRAWLESLTNATLVDASHREPACR